MSQRKKKFLTLFLLLFLLSSLFFFIYYLYRNYRYAITDAVFVQADQLIYAGFTKVGGKIVKLYKKEGDPVSEGELLAEIEEEDYRAKLKALEYEISQVRKERLSILHEANKVGSNIPLQVGKIKEQLGKVDEEIRALTEEMYSLRVQLEQVSRDLARYERLYQEGLVPQQTLEQFKTKEAELKHQISSYQAKKSALSREKMALMKDLKLVLNEEKTIASLKARAESLAEQERALWEQGKELEYYYQNTKLFSPIKGLVAKKFRSEGDVVAPGQPIYALVDPQSFYVLVLLEETKLKGVVKGAKARVWLDSYPGEVFEGTVEEVLPASAATFALVPRDISAGEFTKLAQRIPVRIRLSKGPMHLLRVGLGGKVEIARVR